MEIPLIILALLVIGGALVWDQATQHRHVGHIRQQWANTKRDVTIPPIRTICHGQHPPGATTERIVGALGVVDGAITFNGQRANTFDFTTPLDAIRWMGQRTIIKRSWNKRVEWPELIIHADTAAGWRVYTFTEGPIVVLAKQITALTEISLNAIGESFEDFGPFPAIHMVEDAAGQWQRLTDSTVDLDDLPPEWDGLDHTLYLTPDRLLYDWAIPIVLTQIQRVDVYAPRGISKLNPFDQPLLRIEHTDLAGEQQVTGFLTHAGGDWAGVLENRLDVPVAHHAGRSAG